MARACIRVITEDGDTLEFIFATRAEHPDALDECATRAIRMFQEGINDDADLET